MNKLLIQNAVILPMTASVADSEKTFTGSVGIENSRIVMVTRDEQAANSFANQPDVKVIDGRGKLVMPGLINTHCHMAMTLMRNYADDLPLMQWLNEKIWPFEQKMKPADVYWGAKLGVAEMLLGGTTTVVDMYDSVSLVAQAVDEGGMRAWVCRTMFDWNRESYEREIDDEISRLHGSADGRIQLSIGVHAPYTCSPDTVRYSVGLAEKTGLAIHLHLSETQDEVRQMRERYGQTSTQYLDYLGVFDHRTLAAHCVYLSDTDRAIICRRGVSVLHNPQSNMKLASGVAPVASYMAQGINVSIGTDGVSSNNNLCMWDEMRSASLLAKVNSLDAQSLSAYEVLQMATVNGARTLGMEGELGVLREGALADVIVVDLHAPHLYPHGDYVGMLVYSMQGSDVETVIVGGKVVVDRRRLSTFDAFEACVEVKQRTERIVEELKSNI